MKTIPIQYERGTVEYLLLVHDVLLESIEAGGAVAEYRHGQRVVRIEGRAQIGKLLFQINARIGALFARKVQGKELVKGRPGPLVPGGHLAGGVGMKIMRGTL